MEKNEWGIAGGQDLSAVPSARPPSPPPSPRAPAMLPLPTCSQHSENAQKTGKNGEKMGEIYGLKRGENGHLEKNAAQTAAILWQQRQPQSHLGAAARGSQRGQGEQPHRPDESCPNIN